MNRRYMLASWGAVVALGRARRAPISKSPTRSAVTEFLRATPDSSSASTQTSAPEQARQESAQSRPG